MKLKANNEVYDELESAMSLSNGGRSVLTDEEGKYLLEVPSGMCTFRIQALDYEPLTLENLVIKVGVKKRGNYVLTAGTMAVADVSAFEKTVAEVKAKLAEAEAA